MHYWFSSSFKPIIGRVRERNIYFGEQERKTHDSQVKTMAAWTRVIPTKAQVHVESGLYIATFALCPPEIPPGYSTLSFPPLYGW